MTTKTDPRTQLLAFAATQGWEVDPAVTLTERVGWGSSERTTRQHPYALRKATSDGGYWAVLLDFRVRDTYRSSTRFDNRLRAVELRRFDADGTEVWLESIEADKFARNIGSAKMSTPTQNNTGGWLYSVTHDAKGGGTLRKHAEILLTDVELAVWLAAERKVASNERWAAERRARELDRRQRATLPEGWSALRDVAWKVYRSDGKSDHAALLTALQNAIADVADGFAAEIQ